LAKAGFFGKGDIKANDTGGIKMIPFWCHFSGVGIEKTIVYVKEQLNFQKRSHFGIKSAIKH
jgi:hypothetical protein